MNRVKLRKPDLPDDLEERVERQYQANLHLLREPGWSEGFLRAVVGMDVIDRYQCGHYTTYGEFITCILEGEDGSE